MKSSKLFVLILIGFLVSCSGNDNLFVMKDSSGGSGGNTTITWEYNKDGTCLYEFDQRGDVFATNPIEDEHHSRSYPYRINKKDFSIEDDDYLITFDIQNRTYTVFNKYGQEYSNLSGWMDNPKIDKINWDALEKCFSGL